MKETEKPFIKLKVTEALTKDVGRALARMGPEDLERLEAAVGDTVEVEGKRKALCKVMPAYQEIRGQSRVQLDGLTRENAGVGLDETVKISKMKCRPAERIVLTPTNVTPAERDLQYIGSLLDGLPVLEGAKIQAAPVRQPRRLLQGRIRDAQGSGNHQPGHHPGHRQVPG